MQQSTTKLFSHNLLTALIILKGYQENKNGNKISLKDLFGYIESLNKSGIDTSRFNSFEFEQFLAQSEIYGQLYQSAQYVDFGPRILRVAYNGISPILIENPTLKDDLERMAEILGLERFLFCLKPKTPCST